jgi:hypothetical protein
MAKKKKDEALDAVYVPLQREPDSWLEQAGVDVDAIKAEWELSANKSAAARERMIMHLYSQFGVRIKVQRKAIAEIEKVIE